MVFERFTRDARAAVMLCQEEARERGSREIAVAHLLLGVLDVARQDLSAVLESYGLSADVVRAWLMETSAGGGWTTTPRHCARSVSTCSLCAIAWPAPSVPTLSIRPCLDRDDAAADVAICHSPGPPKKHWSWRCGKPGAPR